MRLGRQIRRDRAEPRRRDGDASNGAVRQEERPEEARDEGKQVDKGGRG